MTTRLSLVRLLLGSSVLAGMHAPALAQGPYYVHFRKQTPATAPARYVLPAVEADNDGEGYGLPANSTSCSTGNTNSDTVHIVLTDQHDELPLRVAPPGTVTEIDYKYRVEVQVDVGQTLATYGCDYELYLRPAGCPTGCLVPPPNPPTGPIVFFLDISGRAAQSSSERAIEVRFLSDPGTLDADLESIVLTIESVQVLGSPLSPPTLAVGANDRVTWLLENNAHTASLALPGDDCVTAKPIFGAGGFYFDADTATPSGGPGSCSVAVDDVWFLWTAPSNGDFFLDTYTSRTRTLLEVYTGICGALGFVDCDDGTLLDLSGSAVQITGATANTQYYVRVGRVGSIGGSNGLLTVKKLQPSSVPFVQMGHSTPATRTFSGQVTTKVVRESPGHSDHFGIRFLDGNLNTFGHIDGAPVTVGIDFRLDGLVQATAGAQFNLYADRDLTIPIPVTAGSFSIDVDDSSIGFAIWAEFLPSGIVGPTYDVGYQLVGTVPISAGTPPNIGWNNIAKWLVIN